MISFGQMYTIKCKDSAQAKQLQKLGLTGGACYVGGDKENKFNLKENEVLYASSDDLDFVKELASKIVALEEKSQSSIAKYVNYSQTCEKILSSMKEQAITIDFEA